MLQVCCRRVAGVLGDDSVAEDTAVCWGVLQVCCSVLQCVAVCCSVL